jgi:PHP family Zn ribbon phosphoesterase
LKLDLHVHLQEATNVAIPDARLVRKLIDVVRSRGLDGIAVTEHSDTNYGYRIKEIVDREFHGEIIVIPGQEKPCGPHHIVELHLPCGCIFRFVAHPGRLLPPYPEALDGIQGVEVQNGSWVVDEESVRRFAEERGLILLCNSDAHTLTDIGRHHNVIDLNTLCTAAHGSS